MWSHEITPKKKWSEDKTMNFVREYRVNDCLWDVNHKDYKNRRVREMMCCKIAETFNCTPDDVRRKIKSLRGAYCHERNKIKDSIESGFDVDNVYVPSVIWYDEMDAIMNGGAVSDVETVSNNVPENVERIDNEHQSGDEDNELSDKKDESGSNNDASDDERTSEISQLDRSSNITEQTSKSVDISSNSESAFHKMNSVSLSAIRKKKKQEHSLNLLTAIDKLHSISTRSDEHGLQDNEFDLFGRCVAQQLKNFKDMKTALRVQHKIHGILSEERIREMTDAPQECCASSSTSQQPNHLNQLRNVSELVLNTNRNRTGLSGLIVPVSLESTKLE